MAYNVNGKIITDYPLMDEICYACKIILKTIVIKNDVLANSKETENSVNYAEMNYLLDTYGTITFNQFYFTEEVLEAYGYSPVNARRYLQDRNRIPEEDRASLMDFSIEYFKENFEEENDYYRMLNGLPPFGSEDQYYIWLTSTDIPSNYTKPVDFSIPLHKQPLDLLNLLYSNGIIDNLREVYKGSNYSYMLYLGDRSIDSQYARSASKWDILYMPSVNYLVRDKFTDFYKSNREMYMNRSYQEFFAQTGEYYDQMMILIVLCQTFSDIVTDTPQWYIRRDIFDLRSCKYFLESAGVEYFKNIPLKYQIRIVKSLNNLIKYKSSSKNFEDIIDIFDVPGTKIYRYWLYKKRDTSSEDGYTLEFISSDYNESYDDYIRDTKYRHSYDSIVDGDKYWDGEFKHEDIEKEIKDRDFTIEGTKYISIEYQISLSEYLYQMEYMLGLIMSSEIYEGMNDFKIGIPSVDETALFNISDIFLFLSVCSYSFYRPDFDSRETEVRMPDDMSEGSEPIVDEEHYDWKKKYFPEMYVVKNGRIYGFNPTLDKNKLIKTLEKRHSHLRFGDGDSSTDPVTTPLTDEEYKVEADKWISELGVYSYIVPSDTIMDYKSLYAVYDTNTRIYNNIKTKLAESSNRDDQIYLRYIFNELFTRPYDIGFVSDGHGSYYTDLIDILRNRDYILYNKFYSIMQESNIESKQEMMRMVMNDIIETLNYYITGDGLDKLYAFTSIESFSALVGYLHSMLNFFKSYKVYMLDPYYTFVANDKIENSVKPVDVISEYRREFSKYDKALIDDAIIGFDLDTTMIDEAASEHMIDMVDIYAHYDPDPFEDLDIDGIHAEDGETEPTVDIDGGTADESVTVPYITLNGGGSAEGYVDFHDLDGSDANEGTKTYYIVDGGRAFEGDTIRADSMGTQKFNYVFDGGSAGKREFLSNCFRIRFIGTEFFGDVIVSPKSIEYIEVKEDGLYIASNVFASAVEFNNLVYILNTLINTIRTNAAQYLEDIDIISDEAITKAVIAECIDEILYNMEYVLEAMANDRFKNGLREYINNLVTAFRNEFDDEMKLDPYAWVDL